MKLYIAFEEKLDMNTKQLDIIKRIGLDEAEINQVIALSEKYSGNTDFKQLKRDLISGKIDYMEAIKIIPDIAAKNGEIAEKLNMLFLFELIDIIYDKYKKACVDDDIIYDTLFDMRIKVNECVRVNNILGISRLAWYRLFYQAIVFKLGRFQYAFSNFDYDYYEKDGVVLKRGMPAIYIHIPQSGEKMDDVTREASYGKAYAFFKKFYPEMLQGDYLPVVCKTWLFFEKHKEFLGKDSSIVRFTGDFDIISKEDCEKFNASIWVFDREDDGNYEEYPQKTTLQKAYVHWLSAGNKPGVACGVKLLKY